MNTFVLLMKYYHKSITDKLKGKTETRISSTFMQKKVQKQNSTSWKS